MTSFSATRFKIGMAAAASVITTIGLVAVPQQGMGAASTRVEVAAVQLDAVLAAEATALVLSAPENDSAATTPIPDASMIQEAVGAAVSGIGETLTNIGRTILDAIGLVIAPIWWLAMPVTYGLYLDTRRRQSPGALYIGTVFDAGGWLMAPFKLGTVLFGRAGSSPAASTPNPARSENAVTPADAQIVEAAPAESLELPRPTSDSSTEPTVRPTARAKVSAPRAKAPLPLSAAATAHTDETATVPDGDTPSAGRANATTSKADAQRAKSPEMTKAGPRN
jgi:hypothetical protein